MPSLHTPSSTQKMMQAYAAGSKNYQRIQSKSMPRAERKSVDIAALCQREITTELNRINELRYTQTNEILPSAKRTEQAVNQIGNNLDTLLHQERFNNIQEEINKKTQEMGDRIQDLHDSIKQIQADFNEKAQSGLLTKDVQKQIHDKLQPIQSSIKQTSDAQANLQASITVANAQANAVLPRTARVAAPEIQAERERRTI